MDLLPTSEQQEIAVAAATFLAKEVSSERGDLRRMPWSTTHDDLWKRCAELGWFGLGLPEDLGGVGYGLAEEVLLFREIGRYLAPGPFLAATLAARIGASAGASQVASAILAGRASVGLAEPRYGVAAVGSTVSGTFDLLDGVDAAYVVAVTPDGAAVIAADALPPVEPHASLDPSVRLARMTLDGAATVAHVAGGAIFDRGTAMVAAMLVGIAEATRDLSAEHAKTRVQFGRPIGVHQAIKHRCADMAVRAEAAGSQMLLAALCVESGRADATFQAAAAKVVATDAAVANAASTIQVHGGMGFTSEHDAHLFLERAHVLDHLLGDRRQHLARLVELPPAQ